MEQHKFKVVVGQGDNNKGPIDECHIVRSFSSSSSDSESGISSSASSFESDSFEDVTSPASSSSSSSADQFANEPLNDMSCLFQQLPIKRGLSKYYQGKAQSFTSLAKVSSLEDLVKPENPYNKKMKTCRSYGWKMGETKRAKCTPSATISRQGSQSGSCSSLSAKRVSDNIIMDTRPPITPQRSTTTIPNQTALFV